jgi:hypothetical protein
MIFQVFLTALPYTSYQDRIASGQIVIADMGARLGRTSYISSTLGSSLTLKLEIDGDIVVDETLQTSSILNDEDYPHYKEFEVTPGIQKIPLSLVDAINTTSFVCFDGTVTIFDGDIFTIPPPE